MFERAIKILSSLLLNTPNKIMFIAPLLNYEKKTGTKTAPV
jgi:hypothetical protein